MNAKMFEGNNLPHEILIATRQNAKLINAFENNMSTDITLSKDQISQIIQSGRVLGKLLGPLLTVGLPLMKNLIKPLAKSILALYRLSAAMFAIDAEIQKKVFGSGTTSLVISNKEINDITKIVQALENSGILLKGVTKTIKNETKEQKGGFLIRHFRNIFIRKFMNRKRDCKSRRKNYKSRRRNLKNPSNSREFFTTSFNKF